jgi:3-oxoacyl-[acyl-carrier protein] reductase
MGMTAGWIEWARGIAKAQNWGDEMAEIEARVVKEILPNSVGRVGRIEDIANLVAFVSSPLTGFINGANFRVDGGVVQSVN